MYLIKQKSKIKVEHSYYIITAANKTKKRQSDFYITFNSPILFQSSDLQILVNIGFEKAKVLG